MTELKVEPKPVQKRAAEPERDNRRKAELQNRLQRFVDRYAEAIAPNSAAKLDEQAAQELYLQLNLEWQDLARKVNNGPDPIHVDPDAFTNQVDVLFKYRERQRQATLPLRQVPLMQFGFLKLHEAGDHTVWLSTLCVLRVWNAEGAPVELYLCPPPPFLEGWAYRLLERMDDHTLVPDAVDGTLTLASLGVLAEVLRKESPAQVSPRVVELANDRSGWLNKVWNAILSR